MRGALPASLSLVFFVACADVREPIESAHEDDWCLSECIHEATIPIECCSSYRRYGPYVGDECPPSFGCNFSRDSNIDFCLSRCEVEPEHHDRAADRLSGDWQQCGDETFTPPVYECL